MYASFGYLFFCQAIVLQTSVGEVSCWVHSSCWMLHTFHIIAGLT